MEIPPDNPLSQSGTRLFKKRYNDNMGIEKIDKKTKILLSFWASSTNNKLAISANKMVFGHNKFQIFRKMNPQKKKAGTPHNKIIPNASDQSKLRVI